MAAELKMALGLDAKLVEDKTAGVFDIFVDESLVFSMSDSGRFPEPGEIVAMFNQ